MEEEKKKNESENVDCYKRGKVVPVDREIPGSSEVENF